MKNVNYRGLADSQLERTLQTAVTKENELKIRILHLLAEVERRRLYSKNYPSLFEYCVRVLKYSGSSAQRRIDSMRAMKLIPEIEQKIVSGELNLLSVAQAQSFFRQEAKIGKKYSVADKKEVLQKLENKSTRECIKELIAISPQSIPQEKRRELTPEKTELKVVLNKDLIEKLDKIKALLSNSNPNMTDQALIEVMAKLTLERIDPVEKAKRNAKRAELKKAKSDQSDPTHTKKTVKIDSLPALAPCGAASPTPINGILETLPAGPSTDGSGLKKQQPLMGVSRYIPSTVKCEVYMRDKGQCSHPNCNSRKFLEYDHIHPVALGGQSGVSNLRLLCRAHNQRAAIERFGVMKLSRYLNQ